MLVEFIKNETHAIHQAVHVRRLSFSISGPTVGSEGLLKLFKILHPCQRKIVRLDIGLVEDENKWELRLV
jgi:hypothetical protein